MYQQFGQIGFNTYLLSQTELFLVAS